MTDFVIVVAALASFASASPGPSTGAVVPDRAPTVGFKTYSDADSCTEAAARLMPRPGTRLVCLPIEPQQGEMQAAW